MKIQIELWHYKWYGVLNPYIMAYDHGWMSTTQIAFRPDWYWIGVRQSALNRVKVLIRSTISLFSKWKHSSQKAWSSTQKNKKNPSLFQFSLLSYLVADTSCHKTAVHSPPPFPTLLEFFFLNSVLCSHSSAQILLHVFHCSN